MLGGLKRRGFAAAAAAVVALTVPSGITARAETPAGTNAAQPGSRYRGDTYKEYSEPFAGWRTDVPAVEASGISYAGGSGASELREAYGEPPRPCVVIPDDGFAEWRAEIPSDGLYVIVLDFAPGDGAGGDVEVSASLDGATPFKELNSLSFKRRYRQAAGFSQNVAGNDIKPEVTEEAVWSKAPLRDAAGYESRPFRFALSAGVHTLRVSGSRGSLAVSAVRFEKETQYPSYRAYIAGHERQGHRPADESPPAIQAENLAYKTDLSVLPASDRSSPATVPQSPSGLRLNTVGGSNWKRAGEAVTWTVEVPRSGLYLIAPRFRQNMLDGIFTSRRLLIDGEVPFEEAGSLRFHYGDGWQLEPLGGGEPYYFYLEAGKPHTLTLEVVIGDVAAVIGDVQNSLNILNAVYRRILMITGVSPDLYRDYHFSTLIPEEIAELGRQRDALREVVRTIGEQAGVDGSYTSVMKKLIFQLDNICQKPESLAKYFEQFKSNLGSLGTWLMSAAEQPLQIDCFYLTGSADSLPKADAGFLAKLRFGFQSFFHSFVTDYGSVGSANDAAYGKRLKVWLQTGRDQTEILRQLVDTGFSKEQRASVRLELVPAGTLLQSVLAGLGPDVVLNNAATEPIDYALRNAVADLSAMPGFEEVSRWFHPSALVPYTYKNRVYALPETFSFLMFFYRRDIFEEAGLQPPRTWDDLVELIPDLQRRNLDMAFPRDLNGYAMMLYQNGGTLYAKDGKKTNLGSDTALNTFLEMSELYTLYDLPFTYDFPNRFRSGEMPCGIQDYTLYNQLTVFAPEIRGLWEFVPVPGKPGPDGKLNNLSVGAGLGDMILSSSRQAGLAWEFLKWWLRADTQAAFTREMESVLGPAAKQPTANMEALTGMSWTSREQKQIRSQLEAVGAVPQVPGGYYLSRVIGFAFNRVYNQSGIQNAAENPVEVLSEYIPEFNDELKRKQDEFEGR